MRTPAFDVELAEDVPKETLTDIPEWTLAECEYHPAVQPIRFRVGEYAYGGGGDGKPPARQCLARQYVVKRIIGRIVNKY